MRNNMINSSIALIVIFLFLIISAADLNSGTLPEEKTVIDYYFQLPDEYFQCETANILSRKDKLSQIKRKDLKKGYILASTSDGGTPVEIALFTDDYMGIKVIAVNVRCGSGCMCRKLDFFFVSDGRLMKSEVEGLFPNLADIEKAAGVTGGYEFVIPEGSKNINVAAEKSGKILLTIEWSGGTFNIKQD